MSVPGQLNEDFPEKPVPAPRPGPSWRAAAVIRNAPARSSDGEAWERSIIAVVEKTAAGYDYEDSSIAIRAREFGTQLGDVGPFKVSREFSNIAASLAKIGNGQVLIAGLFRQSIFGDVEDRELKLAQILAITERLFP